MADQDETTGNKYKIVIHKNAVTLGDMTETFRRELARLEQTADIGTFSADVMAQAKGVTAMLTGGALRTDAALKEMARQAGLFAKHERAMSNAMFGAMEALKPTVNSLNAALFANFDAMEMSNQIAGIDNFGPAFDDFIRADPKALFGASMTETDWGAANIARSTLALYISNPLEEMQRSIFDTAIQEQYASLARTLTVTSPFKDFYSNTGELIEQIRRWTELDSEFDDACTILGIQIDETDPDGVYEQMPYTQILQDAVAVRWLKTHQGRLHTPEASARLGEFLRTGQLSAYTLSRFIHWVTGQPFAGGELWLPPNQVLDIQARDPSQDAPYTTATIASVGEQGAIVTVHISGSTSPIWRIESPQHLRVVEQPIVSLSSQAPTSTPKHEALKCNQWLFVEYFDRGRINLKELLNDWVQLRKEQDYKHPVVNPLASMRTAVNEEKERRKHRYSA